jgi:LPS-assembly lipoprotein
MVAELGRLLTPLTAKRGPFALILVLVASLATSACGFKLRGQLDIPPELNPILIQPRGSQVATEMIQRLQGSQVRLAARPQDARVIVRISNENRSSRVVAVDRNGKVLARELHLGLTFDAVAPDGKQLVQQQSIDVVRSYENPDVEVLGKQLEAEMIYEDMVSDAANRILTRLRAALL